MSNISAARSFIFKTGIFCTFLLLLCSGVVLAADPVSFDESLDESFDSVSALDFNFGIEPADAVILPDPEAVRLLHSLGYIEKIYISGTTVTIEANITNNFINPTWSVSFTSLSDSQAGNNTVQSIPVRQLNSNVIQFDIFPENPGSYNVSMIYAQIFAQNAIITTESLVPNTGINPDKPLLIYLSATSLNLGSTTYYLFNYDYQYFSNDSLNPNLLNEIIGQNFIYFFDIANLRSIYWYGSNDSDVIQFSSETGHSGSTVHPYKPIFYVNPFKEFDLSLNHIFYCPIHDFYIPDSQSGSVPMHECDSDIQWKISMDGEEKDASLFFETATGAVPRHFAFFNGSNFRRDSFNGSQEFTLNIYPVLSHSANFESSALPFLFKIKSDIYDEIITIPFNGPEISIENVNPNKPSLSSLSFSGAAGDEISDILSGSSIIVKTLSKDEFSGISEISSNAEIFTVVDIDFSQNKSVLNEYLSSTNQKAILTFKIPKIVNGAVINPYDLQIYHIVEVDGKNKLELLNIVEISETEEPTGSGIQYYVLSAETSGFSPFAVVSQSSDECVPVPSDEKKPFAISPDDSVNAALLNGSDPSNSLSNGSPNVIDSPSQIIPDLVEKVRGHMSLFSVIIVLASGLFMWNYLHRKL